MLVTFVLIDVFITYSQGCTKVWSLVRFELLLLCQYVDCIWQGKSTFAWKKKHTRVDSRKHLGSWSADQQVQTRRGTTGPTQRAYFFQAVGHAFLHTPHRLLLPCATLLTNYSSPNNIWTYELCDSNVINRSFTQLKRTKFQANKSK